MTQVPAGPAGPAATIYINLPNVIYLTVEKSPSRDILYTEIVLMFTKPCLYNNLLVAKYYSILIYLSIQT